MLEVVFLNDDQTSMRTVMRILKTVFGLDEQAAYGTMMKVHHSGSAGVGRYAAEEAARLLRAATEMARAEDAPLRIVLRHPEESAAALPSTPGRAPAPFLGALLGRLCWRVVPAAAADSSDGMTFTSAAVGVAVWLAFDRLAAGPNARWSPTGVTGITWYALGLLALTWVLYRASRANSFRALLAAIVGALPLPLALTLAVQRWAPADARTPVLALLALVVIVHVNRILASVGAARPRAALLAAAAFTLLFAWGTSVAFVYPNLWYASSDDATGPWADSERLLFEQADRIDAAAARLRAGEPGRPDVFFLGFAGVGHEKVFAEEIQTSERVVSERYGSAGRTLLLVNDRRDLERFPLATVHGLRRALVRIGERMDRSEDVLFLMLTSHGSDEPSLSVSNQTWPLDSLDDESLRSALEASSIRWRVIVISACYSGAFIEPLADENTMIFTSAAKDRTSFGCSDDRDVTEFGGAFIRDVLPRATSLTHAFEETKRTLAERERRAGMTESLPQAHVGTAIATHWDRVEAGRATPRAPSAVGGPSATEAPR